jgi:Carboxypeptidase regulatory-like domain
MLGSKDAGWPIGASDTAVKKDGSFELRNVLPGSYFVWIINKTSTPEVMLAAQTIEVKDSDLENMRLTPVSTSEVRGQLRMENGQKVEWAGASLLLQSSDDFSDLRGEFEGQVESTTGQVKQDGSFDLKTVPAGNYRVRVISGLAALRDCFMKSVSAGGKDLADSGFAIRGGTWSLDVVLSSNGGNVDGVVVDDKNQPVADAEVVAIPEATRQKRRDLYQQGTADQHGHFNLRGLDPGEYTVMALEDLDDDFRDPEFLKSHEGIGQTIHLDEGGHKSISLQLLSPANDAR